MDNATPEEKRETLDRQSESVSNRMWASANVERPAVPVASNAAQQQCPSCGHAVTLRYGEFCPKCGSMNA